MHNLILLDYAHTPDALKICLQNIKDQFQNRKISLVFGCGGERDKNKRPMMGKIANNYCDNIYLTDDNPRNENPKNIRKMLKKYCPKGFEIPNRKKAIHYAISRLDLNDILITTKKIRNKKDKLIKLDAKT